MDDWFEWEYATGTTWGYNRGAVDWSDDVGYATPEEAAISGFPPRVARVDRVQYHEDGSHAVVELQTNEEPYLYPYSLLRTRPRRALARRRQP